MPLKFRKVIIADERFESAGVFDVNNDGILDIVSGEWWYEGPDFKKRHRIGAVQAVGEYYDDFSNIPMDINGDGWTDYVTGGWWGDTLRWRENPGDPSKEWQEHIIAHVGNVETTRAWDVDVDGCLEIIPNTPGGPVKIFKLVTDAAGKGTGVCGKNRIFPSSSRRHHASAAEASIACKASGGIVTTLMQARLPGGRNLLPRPAPQ
jgi:hypothetical protein